MDESSADMRQEGGEKRLPLKIGDEVIVPDASEVPAGNDQGIVVGFIKMALVQFTPSGQVFPYHETDLIRLEPADDDYMNSLRVGNLVMGLALGGHREVADILMNAYSRLRDGYREAPKQARAAINEIRQGDLSERGKRLFRDAYNVLDWLDHLVDPQDKQAPHDQQNPHDQQGRTG